MAIRTIVCQWKVTGARVLIIDDDPTLAEVVGPLPRAGGVQVEYATDGADRLGSSPSTTLPDLVVLDLMLPVLDGLEVCRRLRQAAPIPIVMLTARGEENDRIVGLELGADDYVTKPFSPRELTARVKAVAAPRQRRHGRERGGPRRWSPATTVDVVAHEVAATGPGESALTSKEFDLLVPSS